MGSNEPVRNGCEVIYEIFPIFELQRYREVTSSNPIEVLNFSGFCAQLHKLCSYL